MNDREGSPNESCLSAFKDVFSYGPKLEGFVKSNHNFMVTFNNVIITMLLSI